MKSTPDKSTYSGNISNLTESPLSCSSSSSSSSSDDDDDGLVLKTTGSKLKTTGTTGRVKRNFTESQKRQKVQNQQKLLQDSLALSSYSFYGDNDFVITIKEPIVNKIITSSSSLIWKYF